MKDEHPLMKTEQGYFCCAECYHYDRTPEGYDWCHGRERRMRWNPLEFLCGNFGCADEPKHRTKLTGQLKLTDYLVIE